MKKLLLLITCLICALAVAGPANAITIGLEYLFGTAVPGHPANPAAELVRLNQAIDYYNTYVGPPIPSAPITNGIYDYVVYHGSNVPSPLPDAIGPGEQIVQNVFPFDITTPYLYLVAKFGDQDAFYYLGGQTGEITLVSPFPVQGGGISHITLFNPTPIPEPATMLLLGSGLIGLAGLARRKFHKK